VGGGAKKHLKSVALYLVAASITGAVGISPASAQNWGDLLGGLINAAIVQNAIKKWEKIDPQVRDCLANQYQGQPAQLAQQGIGPDDSRIVPYVHACEQQIAQARFQAEQAERARQAQIEAQQRANEDAARAQQQAIEAQAATEAAAKTQAAEHHRQLVAKYGADDAVAIEAGVVRKGMTKEAVLEARGEPNTKESIPPDAELWTYGSERISFANGKVTYIGH